METIYITAFVVGVLGGVHCLGMCGGVVGGLTFSLDPKVQISPFKVSLFQFSYNTGRIFSYVLVGSIFGFFGASLGTVAAFLPVQQTLQIIAGFFMIALGLYLGGWWFGVAKVEQLGQNIWSYIRPIAQKMTPVKHYHQALIYGLVWGWLPCGLVYSMLIMAMTAGSALSGAAVMLAFGLGTLPNLMLMGAFAFYFTRLSRMVWVKRVAGISVALMGMWQLYLAFSVSLN
jgi:sulfite exporter TauE/SafE